MHCYILSLTKPINVFRLGNKEKKSTLSELFQNSMIWLSIVIFTVLSDLQTVDYTSYVSHILLNCPCICCQCFWWCMCSFFRICIEYCISCLRDVYERRRVAWVEIILTGLSHQMFVSVSCQDAYFHKILSFLWVFFKSKIKQEEFEDTKGVIRIR